MSTAIRRRKPPRRAGDNRDFMLWAFGLMYSLTILVGLVMFEVWKRC